MRMFSKVLNEELLLQLTLINVEDSSVWNCCMLRRDQ